MFNKYITNKGPSSISASITIQEKKAPTDDSIRLLSEMENKAKNNLMNKVIVEDNDLKGKLFIFKDDINSGYSLHTLFTLNGKEYEGTKRINTYKITKREARSEIMEAMRQCVFEALVSDID